MYEVTLLTAGIQQLGAYASEQMNTLHVYGIFALKF